MGGELSLNVTSLADTIRDKVRSTIAASIPDDQINGLIKNEYDNFFKTPDRRYHNDPEPMSPFKAAIKAELDKLLKEKIQEAVQAEVARFTSVNTWDAAGKTVVESIVKEYAPAAIQGMAQAIVTSTLQNMQRNVGY